MNETPNEAIAREYEQAAEIDALYAASLAILNHKSDIVTAPKPTNRFARAVRRMIPDWQDSARVMDTRKYPACITAVQSELQRTDVPAFVIKEWRDKKNRPTSVEVAVLAWNLERSAWKNVVTIHMPRNLSETYVIADPVFDFSYRSYNLITSNMIPRIVIPSLQAISDEVAK